MREFKDIPFGEVQEALIEMLNKLDISGSTSTYNLYGAVALEQEKAKNYKEPNLEEDLG